MRDFSQVIQGKPIFLFKKSERWYKTVFNRIQIYLSKKSLLCKFYKVDFKEYLLVKIKLNKKFGGVKLQSKLT